MPEKQVYIDKEVDLVPLDPNFEKDKGLTDEDMEEIEGEK